MPQYRVMLSRNSNGHSQWVVHDSTSHVAAIVGSDNCFGSDPFSFTSLVAAARYRDHMAREFPRLTYIVVGNWDESPWADRMAEFASPPRPATSHEDEDEDEDEDIPTCDECGEEDEYGDHEQYACEDCGWFCGVCDCNDCLSYSDEFGGSLCGSCYESWEHDRRSETPGLSRRRCSADACGSYDVHHDDDREQFVCDHIARQLVNEGRFVTLAYPLPTLEVA